MQRKGIVGYLGVLFILFALVSGGLADDIDKINLNEVTVEELSKVPGLNKDIAQKILKFREDVGEFLYIEELLSVPGIDDELLLKLNEYLFISPVESDCGC